MPQSLLQEGGMRRWKADLVAVAPTETITAAVTTGTITPFTPATTLPNGCEVVVCHGGAQTITLDKNVLFLSQGGADVALLASSCLRMTGNGALWRQSGAQQTAT